MAKGLVVHEWAEVRGGAENVLDILLSALPTAELLCVWDNSSGRYSDFVVRESLLARPPLRGRKALSLPFIPSLWRHTAARSTDYDWVVTSSHLFAHHVRVSPETPKFSYVYTPARYIWNPELDTRGLNPLVRLVAPTFKWIDRLRARESSSLAAISDFVRQRIEKTRGLPARVIYPPVEVDRLQAKIDWRTELNSTEATAASSLPEGYIIGASRFVRYKNLDAVIDVEETLGIPVVLAGSGPYEARLRERASNSKVPILSFVAPSNAMLYAMIQQARALIFPPVEDFGIVPVEAIALSTPVIANYLGGAVETVLMRKTGALVDIASQDSWRAAFDGLPKDRSAIPQHIHRFNPSRFVSEVQDWILGTTNVASTKDEQ